MSFSSANRILTFAFRSDSYLIPNHSRRLDEAMLHGGECRKEEY